MLRTALFSILMSCLIMGSLLANRVQCRAIDAFENGKEQKVQRKINWNDQKLWYSWDIKQVIPGNADVTLVYTCDNPGSKVEVSFAGQKWTTETKKSKAPVKKGKKTILKPNKIKLGSVSIKEAGEYTVEIRALSSASKTMMNLISIDLLGDALNKAQSTGYRRPERSFNEVEVKDLGITHNTLSEKEKQEGWKLLFNGKDFKGWAGFRKDEIGAKWVIDQNAMHLSSGGGGDIITLKQYKDFEMTMDWQISPKGNSGIFLRTREFTHSPWETALEMQVLDPGHGNAKNHLTSAGSAYALFGPKSSPGKPSGHWNKVRVIVKGMHYKLYLNDVQTVDIVVGSDEWNKTMKASKFWAYPGFALNTVGHIGLQDHSNPVWFRNIKIKEL
ncbi:MAG: DUF1080 domain-containing protein [Planctomycetes bacterium]|nr:DUF1080 domain-containing protein [Planctomycetota bacterium]